MNSPNASGMEEDCEPERFKRHGRINPAFSPFTGSCPFLEGINNENEYQQALDATELLYRTIGDNPNDPRNLLLDMIAQKIEHYEYQTDPVLSQWDKQDGAIALIKVLMRQHGLTQAELPEIGSQGVVSEVLNGKRPLNLRQMQSLAERFDLPVTLFLEYEGH